MVTVLRPLSISELLDRTFHLYRNNFAVFVGITALPQLVVLALQLLLSAMIFQRSLAGMGTALIIGMGTAMLIGLASYLAVEISHAATIIAVSHLHLDRPTSIASAYSSAKSSMGRVIGISLAVGIAVGIGFILLVVPGIYLALAWSLAIPVTVLEGGGLNVSTTRSKALSKGSFGRIFVVYLLMLILTVIVSMTIQFALFFPIRIIGIQGTGAMQATTHALQAVGGFLTASVVGPLLTIALTLLYYDQRVRKEGFDLQLMMSTLEGEQAAAASVS